VTVGAPYLLLGGFPALGRSPLAWLGLLCIVIGASIYFSCAWEFAVRGLGTPAPIAPTKLLVVSGLHRYVRNRRPTRVAAHSAHYSSFEPDRTAATRRVARGHGRICSVSCSSAHCLCGVSLLAGLSLCHFLLGTHAPSPVRHVVRRIPPRRPALDSAIPKVTLLSAVVS
jgi:hypothetical protein